MGDRQTVPWEPFSAMERVEDEAILQELRGELVDTLIYEFTDGEGRRVVGLSKAGVDRVAAEMALKGEVLRELDFRLIPERDSVIAVVKAGRYAVSREGREVLLETVFGTKRQPRRREVYVRGKDGMPLIRDGRPLRRLEADPFVVEVAMVKAARNAKRRLMPESLIARVIALGRGQGKVRRLDDVTAPIKGPAPEAKEAGPGAFPQHQEHSSAGDRRERLRREIGDLLCRGPCPSRDQIEEWWERQGWGYALSAGELLEPTRLGPQVQPGHLEAFGDALTLYQRKVRRARQAGMAGG